MNQPNQFAFTQVLSREQVKSVNLRMVAQPTNPNPLTLPYHPKSRLAAACAAKFGVGSLWALF